MPSKAKILSEREGFAFFKKRYGAFRFPNQEGWEPFLEDPQIVYQIFNTVMTCSTDVTVGPCGVLPDAPKLEPRSFLKHKHSLEKSQPEVIRWKSLRVKQALARARARAANLTSHS